MEKSDDQKTELLNKLKKLRQQADILRESLKISQEEHEKIVKKIDELKKSPKLADVFKEKDILEEMLNKAKISLKSITQEQLEEIQSYRKPP